MSDNLEITPKELSDEEMGNISGGTASVYILKSGGSEIFMHRCTSPYMKSAVNLRAHAVDGVNGCQSFSYLYGDWIKFTGPKLCANCVHYHAAPLSNTTFGNMVNIDKATQTEFLLVQQ